MLSLPTMEAKAAPWTEVGYSHRKPRTCWYWQWQHPQLRCHSCPRRLRSSRTPWRSSTQLPRQLNSITKEINDLCQRVADGGGQPAKTWSAYSLNFKTCQLPSISHIHLYLLNLLEKKYSSTQTPCVPCRNSATSQTPYCKIYLF